VTIQPYRTQVRLSPSADPVAIVRHVDAEVEGPKRRGRAFCVLVNSAIGFREGLAKTIDWYRWSIKTGYGGWAAR